MTRSFLLCITVSVLTVACSSGKNNDDNPTAPTPAAPATRIIRLGGNLNFGDNRFETVRDDGVLTISNDGTANLGINFITYTRTAPNLFASGGVMSPWCMEVLKPTVNTRAFEVGPGETIRIPFRFAPVVDPVRRIVPIDATYRFDCSGTFTVVTNKTSGTDTIDTVAVAVP